MTRPRATGSDLLVVNNKPTKMVKRRSSEGKKKIEGMKVSVCSYPGCTFGTPWDYNLARHLRLHNPNRSKDFHCSVCGKSFDTKHNLLRHLRNVHPDYKVEPEDLKPLPLTNNKPNNRMSPKKAAKGGMYSCPECSFQSDSEVGLKRHEKIHERDGRSRGHGGRGSNSNKFRCDECGLHYSSKSNLQRHWKVHERRRQNESDSGSGGSRDPPMPPTMVPLPSVLPPDLPGLPPAPGNQMDMQFQGSREALSWNHSAANYQKSLGGYWNPFGQPPGGLQVSR